MACSWARGCSIIYILAARKLFRSPRRSNRKPRVRLSGSGSGSNPDAEMAQTIAKGLLFGLKMPAFKDAFSEAEIHTLVREILRKAEKGKVIAPSE